MRPWLWYLLESLLVGLGLVLCALEAILDAVLDWRRDQ